jgi:hypothetical protein
MVNDRLVRAAIWIAPIVALASLLIGIFTHNAAWWLLSAIGWTIVIWAAFALFDS